MSSLVVDSVLLPSFIINRADNRKETEQQESARHLLETGSVVSLGALQ